MAIPRRTVAAGPLPTEQALGPVATALRGRLPATLSASKAVEFSERVFADYRDGRLLPADPFHIAVFDDFVLATLALEHATALDDPTFRERVAPALCEAYFHLDALATAVFTARAHEALVSPVIERMSPEARVEARAHLAASKKLVPWAADRFLAQSDAWLKKHPGDVLVRRYRVRFHDRRVELPALMVHSLRLTEVAEADPDVQLEALAGKVLVGVAPKDALAAFQKAHGELFERIDAVIDRRARIEALEAADAEVAAKPSALAEARRLRAMLALHLPGAKALASAARAAEEAHPKSGDVRLLGLLELLEAGQLETAARLLKAPEVATLEPQDPSIVGARAVVRLHAAIQAALRGEPTEARQLATALERDFALYASVDPFTARFGQAVAKVVTATLADAAVARALESHRGLTDPAVRELVLPLAKTAIVGLQADFGARLDLRRLELVHQVFVEGEKVFDRLESVSKALTDGVGADERNAAEWLVAFAHFVAGRTDGRETALAVALRGADALRGRLAAWREERAAGKTSALCPDGGCVPVGAVYSLIGAVRNQRVLDLPADERTDYAKRTVALMREGVRVLTDRGERFSDAAVQLGTHRAFALAVLRDGAQLIACLEDLGDHHRQHPAVRHLTAAAFAQMNRPDDALDLFERQAADDEVAPALRYDARRWAAFLRLANDDRKTAREHVAAAAALEPKVRALGQRLDRLFIVLDGRVSVSFTWSARRGVSPEVAVGGALYSVLPSPLEDAKAAELLAP